MTGFDDEVRAFIVGDFLERDIKFGDSFYLISFADAERMPRLEISARVMGNDDLEKIKRTMNALARIDTDADLVGALAFAEKHIAEIGNRQKKITMVTSASIPKTSLAVEVVKMGMSQPPHPSSPPVPPLPPRKESPAPQTPITPRETVALPSDSLSSEEQTEHVASTNVSVETQPPEEIESEEKQPKFASPKIITPDDSAPPRTIKPKPDYRNRRIGFSEPLGTLTVVLIRALSIALLLCGAATVLKCRRIRMSVNRAFASLSDNSVDGPCLLSLSVENQNTNIGRRNFHSIKAGFSLTIGGGNSDFLIFLTPLPPSLAKIYFDGEHCSFIPLKKQFFPEITSETLPDCIGRTIRIKPKKNYDILIRIILYESPLQKLNKLFNRVKLPGR
ncbi:MAG: hypothetical protein LBG05_05250 [Treponema sp.]|nr:hypothetical protein [Treponema sp.]